MMTAVFLHYDTVFSPDTQAALKLHCPALNFLTAARLGPSSLKRIHRHDPDLVFVDLSAYKPSRMHSPWTLHNGRQEIICLADSDRFAVEALQHGAVGYVLLPVKPDSLLKAMFQAQRRMREKSGGRGAAFEADGDLHLAIPHGLMSVPTPDGFEVVRISDIHSCESSGSYTILHLQGQRRILASRNLKDIGDMLPRHLFFRIHQGCMVNLYRIQRYSKGRGGSVIMDDGKEYSVSVRKKAEFMGRFRN